MPQTQSVDQLYRTPLTPSYWRQARAALSSPKMLVFADGSIRGTIGGGLGESQVIRRAAAIAGTGRSCLYHFVMDADVAARDGMACGGNMDVLIEDLGAECGLG